MRTYFDLYCGDCIDVLSRLGDGSISMVLVDPPYGSTNNKWDSIIPLEPMWEQLNRVCKLNAAMLFTSAEPFTSQLVMSNLKNFKYDIIWEKPIASGQLNVRSQPLRAHENIMVFYRKRPTYNEQKTEGSPYKIKRDGLYNDSCYNEQAYSKKDNTGYRHARSVLRVSNPRIKGGHPTQKPVKLMEPLISMYTNVGDVVLDFASGSFTTAIACLNTKRSFIGIEKDKHYFQVGKDRLEKHLSTLDYTPEITYNQVGLDNVLNKMGSLS